VDLNGGKSVKETDICIVFNWEINSAYWIIPFCKLYSNNWNNFNYI